ncbi:hypothetical protein ACP4OV_002246 [Aristida adscensionis]
MYAGDPSAKISIQKGRRKQFLATPQVQTKEIEMASKFSCVFFMILLLTVIATAALLFHTGAADDSDKYGQCFTHPTCSTFCKNSGYPKGGDSMPPSFDDCCCLK